MAKEKGVKKTPTGTALEKYDSEHGEQIYGPLGWLLCVLKAQKPHDSRRNLRKREKSIQAEKKRVNQE